MKVPHDSETDSENAVTVTCHYMWSCVIVDDKCVSNPGAL